MQTQRQSAVYDHLCHVVRDYLSVLRIYRKPQTVQHAQVSLQMFQQWCVDNGIVSVQQVDRHAIRRYVMFLMQQYTSKHTVWSYCCDLRAFLHWCVDEDILPNMPVKPRDFPSKPAPTPKPLSVAEIQHLLKTAEDARFSWIAARNRALIYVLLHTGIRRGEVVQMTVADVDRMTFTVMQKGDRLHVVYLNEECVAEIRRYLRLFARHFGYSLQPSDPLWRSYSGEPLDGHGLHAVFRRLSLKSGLDIWCHRFRQTSATLRLASGASTEVVRTALGHREERSLQSYVQLAQRDVARLLDQTSPLRLLRRKR